MKKKMFFPTGSYSNIGMPKLRNIDRDAITIIIPVFVGYVLCVKY